MNALNLLEQDALTEIFNVGVGVAADALYQMTGEHVPLSVPVVELTSQRAARDDFLAREQRSLCAISQTYEGEFATAAVLLFPETSTVHLVRMMVGPDLPETELAEVAQDAMGELGNIVLNAVISNLASSLGMRLEGSLPEVNQIAADAVFGAAGEQGGPVLVLMIDFELGLQHVGGYLAFLLDSASTDTLLRHLRHYLASVS